MAQLHRYDRTVDHHRRAEAGPKPEEEHLAALVASERLHGGVVGDLRRALESSLEVEADPTRTEIHGV